jgi:hypothetical protein
MLSLPAACPGVDFAATGYAWNSKLCSLDSDGDGVTNGEELGDPCCVWQKGAVPARTTMISHPGQKSSSSLKASVSCVQQPQVVINTLVAGPELDTSRACAGKQNIIVLGDPSLTSKAKGADLDPTPQARHACVHVRSIACTHIGSPRIT